MSPRASTFFSLHCIASRALAESSEEEIWSQRIPHEAQTHVARGCLAKWEDVPCLILLSSGSPDGPILGHFTHISAKSWT